MKGRIHSQPLSSMTSPCIWTGNTNSFTSSFPAPAFHHALPFVAITKFRQSSGFCPPSRYAADTADTPSKPMQLYCLFTDQHGLRRRCPHINNTNLICCLLYLFQQVPLCFIIPFSVRLREQELDHPIALSFCPFPIYHWADSRNVSQTPSQRPAVRESVTHGQYPQLMGCMHHLLSPRTPPSNPADNCGS